jgi:hypothetical protein
MDIACWAGGILKQGSRALLQCLEIAVQAPGSKAKTPVTQLHGLLNASIFISVCIQFQSNFIHSDPQSREIGAGEGRGLKDHSGVLGHGGSCNALHV